jgi:hypothetical protein
VNVHTDIVGKIKTGFVNVKLARTNSMNVFYAHINVTEPYCTGGLGRSFVQILKTMLDAMQPDVLPRCPIQVSILVRVSCTFLLVSIAFLGTRWSCEPNTPLFNRRILSVLGERWQALSSIRVLHGENGIDFLLQIILHQ